MKAFTHFALIVLFTVSTYFTAAALPGGLFDRLDAGHAPITLSLDMVQLEANRRNEDYLAGSFTTGGAAIPVKVRVRGRYRRTHCVMPPLKLKFNKEWLRAHGLNDHNDFKLVTHCLDGEAGMDALLREQLAYQLYAQLTGRSLRTQLVDITYHDSNTGTDIESRAILIEDTDEMAERLNGRECDECYNTPLDRYTTGSAELLTLFQYMIGNNDFSLRMQRNLKLVQTAEGMTPVPYDFDFSALVAADYHNNPTERRHLVWEFPTTPDFSAARDLLLAKEDALLATVAGARDLCGESRQEMKWLLKEFFRDLKKGKIQFVVE
ncbi:MAG: hypothetical protein WBA17_06535 [Saprospiraceae bacterium]